MTLEHTWASSSHQDGGSLACRRELCGAQGLHSCSEVLFPVCECWSHPLPCGPSGFRSGPCADPGGLMWQRPKLHAVVELTHACSCEPVKLPSLVRVGGPSNSYFSLSWEAGLVNPRGTGWVWNEQRPSDLRWEEDAPEAVTACAPADATLQLPRADPGRPAAFLKLSPLTGLLVRTNRAPDWPRNGCSRPHTCRAPDWGGGVGWAPGDRVGMGGGAVRP